MSELDKLMVRLMMVRKDGVGMMLTNKDVGEVIFLYEQYTIMLNNDEVPF